MDKDNEIKGEWRAGIYDYGMFIENMRKLHDMRKKKSSSEEFEETAAAAFGIFSGLIAGIVALLNYNGPEYDAVSPVLFAFCIFCGACLLTGSVVLGILQALPKKSPERAWLIPCGKTEEWCVRAVKILRLVSSEQNREKIYGALLRLDSLPENISKVKGVTEDDIRTECILAHLGFPVELDLRKGAALNEKC